jgi:hypothetical protein
MRAATKNRLLRWLCGFAAGAMLPQCVWHWQWWPTWAMVVALGIFARDLE